MEEDNATNVVPGSQLTYRIQDKSQARQGKIQIDFTFPNSFRGNRVQVLVREPCELHSQPQHLRVGAHRQGPHRQLRPVAGKWEPQGKEGPVRVPVLGGSAGEEIISSLVINMLLTLVGEFSFCSFTCEKQ